MEEKEQVKNQQEKTKKKVNLSTLVCVIIIFLLVIALMVVCYFGFLKKDESTNSTTTNVISNQNITTNEEKTNKIVDETKTNKEKGEELSLNNNEVKNIVKKFNFGFLSHSIYKVGDFNVSNIPNDLVLRLGWHNIKDEDRTLNTYTLQEKTNKDILAKSIKNIFGNNVKYQDKSFRYADVEKFSVYATGDVYYNNDGNYNSTHFQGGGATCPFVYEQVQKVIKSNDEIKLYVKAGFVDTSVLENGEIKYQFYKNYNFNRDEFENKLITVKEDDFIDEAINDNDDYIQLSLKTHNSISSIIDKLDTYVYTFTLDKDSGEYYFTAFNKE